MKPSRLSTFLPLLALAIALPGPLQAAEPNTLDAAEKAAGFELLFDGKALGEAWKHGGNWVVWDGAIARTGKGGSLVYVAKKVPDDFELRFEWMVAEGSNSGVYYRPGQYEYQILDNGKHADGVNPRTSAASLYFCVAPSHDATRPVTQWNQGRIVCKGTIIQHWLNGEKVVDFDYADPANAEHVERLNKRGGDLTKRGANLSLQDHGDSVWYRSLRMRTIPADEKVEHSELKQAEIPPEGLKKEQAILDRIRERQEKQKQKAPEKKK